MGEPPRRPDPCVGAENATSGGCGGTTICSDTFETATGWTTNPNGTDTATTGQWVRGDPAATSSGTTALQLGTTVSGSNDLVTGAAAGAGAGDFDVDGGTTSIQSPTIALPPTGNLSLSFAWYLTHLTNSSSADFFRVSVVVGTTPTVVFTQAGAATNRAGAWATANVSLNSFAGQTTHPCRSRRRRHREPRGGRRRQRHHHPKLARESCSDPAGWTFT